MPRTLARAALAALLLGAAPAAAQDRRPTPTAGRWTLASVVTDTFALEVFWDDGTNWPRRIAFAELHGAAPRDIAASTPAAVTFRVERDAGDFEFEGTFYRGRGAGTFRYRPDRRFADTLRALGVAEVDGLGDHDLKNLAWGDLSADAVREFRAMGLAPLRGRDLVELAIRFVTPEYARALRALGVPGAGTVAGLVELRFNGVPVDYVRELDALGYRGIPAPVLVEMRRSAVTPDFIRRVRAGGLRDATPQALIELRQRERARVSWRSAG
jgi:hypothetical protein